MELNSAQKRAVLETEGPLLIIAGAGTGKTRTVTHRISHLIKKGISPSKILAVTFTNKAAKEMRDRVLNDLNKSEDLNRPIKDTESPFISTFHSLGVRILRDNYKILGISKNFVIADKEKSKQILKKACKNINHDPKDYDLRKIMAVISKQKNSLANIDGLEKSKVYGSDMIAPLWREYENILEKESSLDFDDLIIKPIKLLQENKEVREKYQDLWQYIHIDEYQDTNRSQYTFSKILSEKHNNICVVGDMDQTIFTWRGAKVSTILNFERDFPGAKIITLEENYRSTQKILCAANNVIRINQKRKEKELFTKNMEGENIECAGFSSEYEEAREISNKALKLTKEGVPPKEIAVLYRTNFQSRALEEAFLSAGIPYTVVGTRFLDRKEVKDILAFIEVARNQSAESSLIRIINTPPRGIGKTTALKVISGKKKELKKKARESVDEFFRILDDIKKASEKMKPSELVKYVIERTKMEEFSKSKEEEERIENMKELASLAKLYDEEGVDVFLEKVALSADQDKLEEDPEGIRLMTVHSAKGLEFDHCFISGMEEGLFPHNMSESDTDHDEEEERRLFYVALTRARKKVFLSYARVRTIFGSTEGQEPSQFLSDIDPNVVTVPEESMLSREPLIKIEF